MRVPEQRISILVDEAANRANILEHFQRLANTDVIQRDDPILIFYAGHGTQIERQGRATIEMICPYDFRADRGCKTDISAQGIPDFTIRHLLNRIAVAKGNNIVGVFFLPIDTEDINLIYRCASFKTVIFDCCHAGSATRAVDQSMQTRRVRGVDLSRNYAIHPSLDRGLFEKRFWRPTRVAPPSHILLAACQKRCACWEDNDQGMFTKALLARLRALGTGGTFDITYEDLIMSLNDIPQYVHDFATTISFPAVNGSIIQLNHPLTVRTLNVKV